MTGVPSGALSPTETQEVAPVDRPVRVRIAPSPTGYFHVGTGRTALYNWLFARQRGGVFVLRIEDTDTERNREEWVAGIAEALEWLGLDWDEGPLRQSDRLPRYAEVAADLLARGYLYYCDCRREEIDERARAAGRPPGYDRHCRDRGLTAAPGRALRFAVPLEGETVVDDVVRGRVVVANASIEDFVVVRGNGAPLFLLTNTVDDVDQAITHVIRGEEHLPNTPKHRLVWEAIGGGPPPVFAHLPVLVNARRQKLSKRRDRVALEDYRAQGYLPEAMVNYLALLGWGPSDGQEFLSREELLARFRLERVGHAPAFFDETKLRHFNGAWLRALPVAEFLQRAEPFLRRAGLDVLIGDDRVAALAPLVQERVATLAEVPEMVGFLAREEVTIDDASRRAAAKETDAAEVLLLAAARYENCEWESGTLEAVTRALAEERGRPLRRLQVPLRVAVTGRTVGPPLFQSMEVLGRPTALFRLRSFAHELTVKPTPDQGADRAERSAGVQARPSGGDPAPAGATAGTPMADLPSDAGTGRDAVAGETDGEDGSPRANCPSQT